MPAAATTAGAPARGPVSAAIAWKLDRRQITSFTLIGLALIAAAWLPSVRVGMFLALTWFTAAAFGWRIRSRALRPRAMWLMFTAVLGLLAAAETVRATASRETPVAVVLIVAAHVCAVPSLLLLLRSSRNSVARIGGWWTEWLLLLLAAAATTTQISMMSASDGSVLHRWLAAAPSSPPLDSLLICLVLRLMVTRSYLPRALRMLLWGAGGLLAFDLSVGATGHRLITPGSSTLLVGIAAVAVLLMAVLEPSVSFPLTGMEHHPAPTGSLRLMAMTPLAMAPPALWMLGAIGALPATSATFFAAAQSAITLCALLLAVQSLRVVEDLAERDVVTGLINRRGLPRVTRKILSSRGPHARASLAVIDLDGFKLVNDRHGHDIGDELLRAVANRLRHAVGRHGAVCRVGGDEFVIVYVEDRADVRPAVHTRNLAQRIAAALERPCDVAGLQIQAAASIGVTPLSRASDLVQVMVNSDAAMYAAKKANKSSRTRSAQRETRHDDLAAGREGPASAAS